MFKRFFRVVAGQLVQFAPEAINWIAGTALPAIPPPWGLLVGAALNALGKYVRQEKNWTWVPV